jgi:hypothetical protein
MAVHSKSNLSSDAKRYVEKQCIFITITPIFITNGERRTQALMQINHNVAHWRQIVAKIGQSSKWNRDGR